MDKRNYGAIVEQLVRNEHVQKYDLLIDAERLAIYQQIASIAQKNRTTPHFTPSEDVEKMQDLVEAFVRTDGEGNHAPSQMELEL